MNSGYYTRVIEARLCAPEGFVMETRQKCCGTVLVVGTGLTGNRERVASVLASVLRERGRPATEIIADLSGADTGGFTDAIGRILSEAEKDTWKIAAGQGSLSDPRSAPLAIGWLYGARPDALVLCHDPEDKLAANIDHVIAISLMFARRVNPEVFIAGIACATGGLDDGQAEALLAEFQDEYRLPCVDPLRRGAERIVNMIVREWEQRAVREAISSF